MEINIKNDLTVNEYNNLRNTVGWDSKDMEIAENAIKKNFMKNVDLEKFHLIIMDMV